MLRGKMRVFLSIYYNQEYFENKLISKGFQCGVPNLNGYPLSDPSKAENSLH